MSQPNVIVIMDDQHRADALSCAGSEVVKTPNIDALAARGVRFTRAYTPTPVCMPARCCFLSGLFPHNHGVWRNLTYLDPKFDTIPKRLQSLGYRTCHIGKGHFYGYEGVKHLDDMKPRMNALGFQDVFETTGPGGMIGPRSIATDRLDKLNLMDVLRDDYRKRGQAEDSTYPTPLPEGETIDDFVGRTTEEYIEAYDRKEPFFIFSALGAPHGPMDPPESFAKMYKDKDMGSHLPYAEPEPWVSPMAAEHQKSFCRSGVPTDHKKLDKFRAAYFAKISHVDDRVGRIVEALKQKGLLDSTIVIFTSDHGEMLGDLGRKGKFVFYEGSANVPLVVAPPNCTHPGTTCDGLVNLVDIFPTLVEAAGGDTKGAGFGTSFYPLINEPDAEHVDAIFGEHVNRAMIRTDRYKMVVGPDGDLLKLYDMKNDPREAENLAGKEGMEQVETDLRKRLLKWYLQTQIRPEKKKKATA